MTQRLYIPQTFPSLNEVIAAAKGSGGRGAGYARMKRDLGLVVFAEAKRARLQPVARAYLRFEWREKDKRRDPDNVAAARKFILDGLVNAGVLPGDGWASVAGWSDSFTVDRHCPGVAVEIEPAA